jgi:hypothetical protein
MAQSVFLCSDADGWMIGQTYRLNGGYRLQLECVVWVESDEFVLETLQNTLAIAPGRLPRHPCR